MNYKEIIDFWFNGDIDQLRKERWFATKNQADLDEEIKTKYNTILKRAENDELNDWKTNPNGCLALTLILDQFSRHIYRDLDPEQIIKNTNKALENSKLIIKKNWHKTYNVPKFVFLLMPFRHTKIPENIKYAIQMTNEKKVSLNQENDLLNRFYNASIKRLETETVSNETEYSDEDILEHFPFTCEHSDAHTQKVYQSIDEYLVKYKNPKDKHVVVSLSGGVDSMVITKVLTLLESKHNFKTVAIHINYNNRSESTTEANYIENWCDHLGVIFEQIIITDIKRGITPRDEYERKSRSIRFDTYQKILTKYNCSGIHVGHHRGDIQENVISNMMRGMTLLNLPGMYEISRIENVDIMRPLLNDNKSLIFDFAHKYGIPYFKDTTPQWSTRGKLRNKLIPLLKEMYGDAVLEKLSTLAEESQDIKQITDRTIITIVESIRSNNILISIDCNVVTDNQLYLWKHALQEMFYSIGFNKSNIRTIRNFIEQVKLNKNQWITFSNKSHALLLKNNFYVFKKNVFLNRKKLDNTSINNCSLSTYKIGLWSITISKSQKVNTYISDITILTLATGDFSYQLETSNQINIETNRNTRLVGTYNSDRTIVSRGFPSIVINKKKQSEYGRMIYNIHYSLVDV